MLYVVLLEIEPGSLIEVAPCLDLLNQLVCDFIYFRMLNMSKSARFVNLVCLITV
jgi:hypothetical protein